MASSLSPAKSQANPQQRQGLPQQFVLAIQPHDGKVLWKTEVGTFRQGQQYYYYYMPDTSPQPRLVYRAGAIYLDTHVGVLARLDAESGAFDWGYGYKTAPFQSGYRFFYYYMTQEPQAIGGPPLADGRGVPRQGDAVRASLRGRAQQDEGPLGAADHEGLAPARRRRQRRLSGGRRVERGRSEDAEALVGDTRAQRQHGRARPGAAGRPVATDVARHLRDRSPVGRRAADLPRQRPGRRSGATCCSPIGGCWLSPIARSPPIPAGRPATKSPPATTPHLPKEQTRHE